MTFGEDPDLPLLRRLLVLLRSLDLRESSSLELDEAEEEESSLLSSRRFLPRPLRPRPDERPLRRYPLDDDDIEELLVYELESELVYEEYDDVENDEDDEEKEDDDEDVDDTEDDSSPESSFFFAKAASCALARISLGAFLRNSRRSSVRGPKPMEVKKLIAYRVFRTLSFGNIPAYHSFRSSSWASKRCLTLVIPMASAISCMTIFIKIRDEDVVSSSFK
mmetsp:Transcript_23393/g.55388  ORF Transcript_23393/g.55388 Transcript_23393/m.55388 type:complete len:221 (+) Transcript_23393:734-1396(+)